MWLDATGLEHFDRRFPTIHAELVGAGLDPATDWLPVAPAAHHQCGGIVTDLSGATDLPGLWAAGETSCSGVHGANRLASNSLLEGMVFGPRAVEAIAAGVTQCSPTGAMRAVEQSRGAHATQLDDLDIGGTRLPLPERAPAPTSVAPDGAEVAALRRDLQLSMSIDAGVMRNLEGLTRCAAVVERTLDRVGTAGVDTAHAEVRNLAEIARVLVAAAIARTESRGTHARTDFPGTDPSQARRLVVGTLAP